MKKLLLILVMCLTFSSVQAVTMDSLSWENKYECDVMPVAAGWTAAGGFEADFTSVAAGVLKMNALSGPGNWFGWYEKTSGVNFTTGATIEFRAKLIDGGGYYSALLELYDGDQVANIGFQKSGTSALQVWSASPGSGVVLSNALNQWHTFRVTVKEGEGIKWYMDGNSNPIHYGDIKSGAGTKVVIGDYTGGSDSNWEIDYIRWTGAGAIAVPEPVSMGLMLAGLLFVRKRK